MEFLNKAGKVLASSLDYEATLASVAELVVPDLADWCTVAVKDPEGTLRRVALANKDPEKVRWAEAVAKQYPEGGQNERGIGHVIQTGRSLLYSKVSDEDLVQAARDPQHLETLRRLELGSAMIVPLVGRKGTIGAITFLASETGRYGQDHLNLAEDLASQAALAIENARLYRALAESEHQFRTTADHAPVLIWMCSEDGHRTFFNRPWLEFRGRKLEEELGTGWQDGVHPEDIERLLQTLETTTYRREPFEIEYRLQRFDDVYRWVLERGVPRHDPDGGYAGFTGSCVDITERKEALEAYATLNTELENRVAQRTAELRQAVSDLEAFSYSVSHDLRAPLRSIRGFAGLLKEDLGDSADEEVRDSLGRILTSGERMSQLIDDLLAFSRVGRTQLWKEPVDLAKIAREVVTSLSGERRCADSTQFLIPDEAPAVADARLMKIVLENLIGNACKFSGKGKSPCVEFSADEADGQTVYLVRDNGVGFDPQYQAKLFQPFERLHADTEFSGSGIGLTIVQRIILRHGGRIWAESAPGAGATFYFTLDSTPARPADSVEAKQPASRYELR